MPDFNKKSYGIINRQDLKSSRTKLLYFILLAICGLIAFVSLAPPIWVMLSSLKDIKEFFAVPATIIPRSFEPQKIIETWKKIDFGKFYVNSFIMVGGSVICAILFNGLIAYVISVLRPKGSKLIFYLILWSLMIPPTISLIPLFKNIVALHQINSFLPLWLSYGANAFFILLYKSFYDGIPASLIEAAKLDGCTNLGMFFRIIIPLSKSVNIVIIIMAVNNAWSDFLLPYLVLKDRNLFTVMVKLFQMREVGGLPMDYQMLALCFATIPPVLLFIIFQKHITQGIALTGIKA